jgi:voltage-gated potassium channel
MLKPSSLNLPFYLLFGINLRSLRALRFIRILKLARYNKPLKHFTMEMYIQ